MPTTQHLISCALRKFYGVAVVSALAASLMITAPAATAMPYRCDSVDPTSAPSAFLTAAPLPDPEQAHPDCAGSGMAGFTFTRGGSSYLRMDLFSGNNTYRAGTGKAGGWSLHRDTAGHGGKAWKLKDRAGSTRASIYSDGKFACDRYSQCAV